MRDKTMQERLKEVIYSKKEEQKIIEARCQNCGKTVMIPMPFYGCVFYIDCMKGESYESADAPEFKQRFNSWIGK